MEEQATLAQPARPPRPEAPAPEWRIGVFGQGFVGLPLALSYSLRGCRVLGIDVDQALVDGLNAGVTGLQEQHPDLGQSIQALLAQELEAGRYRATSDAAAALRECNAIIVTVGIPIIQGQPLLLHLKTACRTIGRNLKPDDLVLIRSTVMPGTTETVLLPLLEAESGLRAGRDFQLAYAPERIAEGRAFAEIAAMPTLVAGIDAASAARAEALLVEVCRAELIATANIRAAETAKIFENLQRDANIAIVQEMARFSEAMGLDIFEVIRLANTHPRVQLLEPGPGVGGYCIPNAYHYLAAPAVALGVDLPLLERCRAQNAALPEFFVDKLQELLAAAGKPLAGAQIGALGLAMKDGCSDDRESPALDICRILMVRGAVVRAYDPLVAEAYPFQVASLQEALRDADGALILARQPGFAALDGAALAGLMRPGAVCLDTRALIDPADAAAHQLAYWRI